MILNPLLEKIQTAFLAVLFLAAGLYTFGNGFIFDRLYIAILFFACWICRKEWNLLSVIAIIALERIVEEVAWLNLSNAYLIKLPLYSLCTYAIYKFCDGMLKWYFLACAGFVFASEFHWWRTNYDAPEIYWYIYTMTQSLVVRWLFIHRCFILSNAIADRYPGRAKSLGLDYVMSNLLTIYAFFSTFTLFEYLLRHIFGLQSIDVIYYAYPYVAHGLSTFILYAVFLSSVKFKQLNSINA